MKLIIAGSRHWHFNHEFIRTIVNDIFNLEPAEVVCGGAPGIDQSGKMWAIEQYVKFKVFEAEWDKLGKAAGPKRNAEMADYADELLLIWDGKSKGSTSMRMQMDLRGKPIYEVIIKESNTVQTDKP